MELTESFGVINNFLSRVPEDLLKLESVNISYGDNQIEIMFEMCNWENSDNDEAVMEGLETIGKHPNVIEFGYLCEKVTFYLKW